MSIVISHRVTSSANTTTSITITKTGGIMDAQKNILLICANPRGTDSLRTAEEDRTLRESIQLSPHRDQVHIQTLNAATIDDLRRALLSSSFDVVHFSGHGTQQGLMFEDSNGRLMVPSSEALADLQVRRDVKTVLLNACYSLSVGRLTAIGTEFTIATTGPISDPAAIEFTRGFYDSIGAGNDAVDAYQEGLSTAKLKDLRIDTILLRSGEEYVAPAQAQDSALRESDAPRTLVGIAVDTSGSMTSSIQNRSGGNLSRLQSVQKALTDVGAQVRAELSRRSGDMDDYFGAFIYAFGMRIGNGVADIASLWQASKNIDISGEIEKRRQRYEARGRQQAAAYGPLAALARNHGFGDLVDSVTDAAMTSAREKIVAEIGDQIVSEANRIGDSNLTAQDLTQVFESERSSNADARVLEHVVYGLTPMTTAAKEIQDRFRRTDPSGYEQRMLIVVSDGDPTDGDPRGSFFQIRSDGVTIVSCFVTDEDVADPRVLLGSPGSSWTPGARLMWEIASEVEEASPFARYLLSQGWSIEPGARLFVQVNHSDVLGEFVQIAGSHFSAQSTELLPRGR